MKSKSEKRRYTSARERAEKQSTGFTGAYLRLPDKSQLFKPKAGTMLLDILPYQAGKGNPWAEPGSLHWERTFWTHRCIGANQDSFLCPRMNSKKRCPICEYRMKLMKEGDDDKEELVKELAPKQRQLFNVINLKDPDKGVQVWDFSNFLFGKVLDARLRNADEDDNWDQFFFLEGGYTLKVGFAEETYAGTSFFKAETIDFKPRKQDYDKDILEQVAPLDDILIEEDYDRLKKVLFETKDDEDEDSDEDEKPSHKSKKTSHDSDDDDDDSDDSDEEEEKPKKKAPSDKDDDWDEFDDDEDEKPKSKKSTHSKSNEDDDDSDDDDEDEKPSKSKSKSKDDDDDDDWEEDREEKPSKKKAAKDEDEEDSDDDEEDEDAPSSKRKYFGKEKLGKGWKKDEEDEDSDDDDDDDEEPVKKKSSKDQDDEDDDE